MLDSREKCPGLQQRRVPCHGCNIAVVLCLDRGRQSCWNAVVIKSKVQLLEAGQRWGDIRVVDLFQPSSYVVGIVQILDAASNGPMQGSKQDNMLGVSSDFLTNGTSVDLSDS